MHYKFTDEVDNRIAGPRPDWRTRGFDRGPETRCQSHV
jgi:hypothetical protein